jgi:hypothetical protein
MGLLISLGRTQASQPGTLLSPPFASLHLGFTKMRRQAKALSSTLATCTQKFGARLKSEPAKTCQPAWACVAGDYKCSKPKASQMLVHLTVFMTALVGLLQFCHCKLRKVTVI